MSDHALPNNIFFLKGQDEAMAGVQWILLGVTTAHQHVTLETPLLQKRLMLCLRGTQVSVLYHNLDSCVQGILLLHPPQKSYLEEPTPKCIFRQTDMFC